MAKINFHFQSSVFTLPYKRRLRKHIKYIFNTETRILNHLNIIFCSDKFLLKINKRYLNHDFYTDVITFDLSQNRKEITGEIYISVERVKENAKSLKIPFVNELHRVIYHGALHLCGYSDNNQRSKRLIRKTEDYYLDIFFNNKGST